MGKWSTYGRRQTVPQPLASLAPRVLYSFPGTAPSTQPTTPPYVFQARRIRPTQSGIMLALRLTLSGVGSPTGSIILQMHADADPLPGAMLTQWSPALASSLTTVQTLTSYSAPELSMIGNAYYWIAVGVPLSTPTDYVNISLAVPSPAALRRQAQSTDGITWVVGANTRSYVTTVWGVLP